MLKYQKNEIENALNHICYCYFVYLYFLDGSTFACALRSIGQLQSISPKALTQSLRLAVYAVLFTNIICILRHFFKPPSYGIIVDVVGRAHDPSKSYLVLIDILIVFIQLILVFVLHSDDDVDDGTRINATERGPEESSEDHDGESTRNRQELPSETEEPPDRESDLVVDIKFWEVIRRIAKGDGGESGEHEFPDLETGFGLRLRSRVVI